MAWGTERLKVAFVSGAARCEVSNMVGDRRYGHEAMLCAFAAQRLSLE
jgi:hypothetical protein